MAVGRLGDAGEDLEQRALPCPVAADDADHFSALDLERDVFQCPDLGFFDATLLFEECRRAERRRRKGEATASVMTSRSALVTLPLPDAVLLGESLATNGYISHCVG